MLGWHISTWGDNLMYLLRLRVSKFCSTWTWPWTQTLFTWKFLSSTFKIHSGTLQICDTTRMSLSVSMLYVVTSDGPRSMRLDQGKELPDGDEGQIWCFTPLSPLPTPPPTVPYSLVIWSPVSHLSLTLCSGYTAFSLPQKLSQKVHCFLSLYTGFTKIRLRSHGSILRWTKE